jgi:Ribbon-helix-helix protein, copG family
MGRLERLSVQVESDVKTEIESAAAKEEISAAAIVRQAIRDWAIRRQVERAQRKAERTR